MVRAKFYVSQVVSTGGGQSILLYPVTGGSEENDTFFNATPSGAVAMVVTNEVAVAHFKVGDEFYVDFTKASDH